eukprot:211353-Ditylum_brightwellii.AAC.1
MEMGKARGKKRKDELYTGVLTDLQADYTADLVQSVEHAGKCMDHWINVVQHTAKNSVLGQNEFCNM